jgi:hypothetical protein
MNESEQDDKDFDEQLEHTILDQLLLDWDIDTAHTVGAVPPSGSDLSYHGQISDLFAKMVRFWSDFCQ